MEKGNLEMVLEDISGKFDLVLEGQESLRQEMHVIRDELSEKIETSSFKIDVLNQKIDGVEEKLARRSMPSPPTCRRTGSTPRCIASIKCGKIRVGIMFPDSLQIEK
jgi:hypothetical protein